jgi:predicted TIM-barrel fold metal-dependent hydrolase
MPVIDVQVHPFDRNHPGRPWASPSHGLNSATGEEMVAAMNSVGVDGAIMVSSFSAYEYDPSYALEVYNTYPDKFRVVTPVDATNPAIDDVVAKWAATPGARGIRIRMRDGLPMEADHPGLNRAFAAAANTVCLSICFAGASWTKGCRTSSDTAIRSSLSTISASYNLLARRSPPMFGPIFPSCLPWLNTRT